MITKPARQRARDERGVSMIELLVLMVILSGALMSLAAAMGYAYTNLGRSNMDMDAYAAQQSQVEALINADYNSVASGSSTIGGYNMSWTVSGVHPKQLVLDLHYVTRAGMDRVDRTILFYAHPDST